MVINKHQSSMTNHLRLIEEFPFETMNGDLYFFFFFYFKNHSCVRWDRCVSIVNLIDFLFDSRLKLCVFYSFFFLNKFFSISVRIKVTNSADVVGVGERIFSSRRIHKIQTKRKNSVALWRWEEIRFFFCHDEFRSSTNSVCVRRSDQTDFHGEKWVEKILFHIKKQIEVFSFERRWRRTTNFNDQFNIFKRVRTFHSIESNVDRSIDVRR